MSDLALVQLTPGVMTDNLAIALSQPGDKPWAFNKFMSQMKGMQIGVHIAFAHVVSPTGGPLGRSGPVPPDCLVAQLVVGRLTRPLAQTDAPFFDGFPWEFWYELLANVSLPNAIPLTDIAATMNELIGGLDITADALREQISNARSSKVGMFFDGMVRKADYFKNVPGPGSPSTSPPVPTPPTVSTSTAMSTAPDSALRAAAEAFAEAVGDSGLVFRGLNEHLPRSFLAGVATKRFAILTGLSGSGKTQLARAFGHWLGTDAGGRPRYLVEPVRADWTSPDPLLGYEDVLLPPDPQGRRAWQVPRTLELMLRAHDEPTHLWLLVLDEMNLAHVERYFADALSGIESNEAVLPNLEHVDGTWYQRIGAPTRIPLPKNLVIVGTVNVDETTYQFSPKVLDRAFSFEFRVTTEELDGDLRSIRTAQAGSARDLQALHTVVHDADWHLTSPSPHTELPALLVDLHAEMSKVGLEFGHRTYRESMRFAAVLEAMGIDDEDEVWDWIVMSKLLPRVHGSRRQLEAFLDWLHKFALGDDPNKPPRPLVARKVGRMLVALRANQFAGFAE